MNVHRPPVLSPVWPRPLKPGGTIGLVSPSGPSPAASIERAVSALTDRGYRVVVGPNAVQRAGEPFGYLAGTDAERVADLNAFLRDPSIDLILSLRGGYGAGRLLAEIDYAAFAADPKPLVGYSDITALNLAFTAQANVVSFSGIMATAGDGFAEDSLHPYSEASFWHATGDDGFPRVFSRPEESAPWTVHRAAPEGQTIVSGPVIPVCLTLLTSLVGTPYVPDLTGAILLLEDIHEDLYRVDRALNQLRLAGLLENLSALLIGSFNGTTEEEEMRLSTGIPALALEFTPPTVAVASGVAYGHIPCRMTVPAGAWADVDLTTGTLSFYETKP